MKPYGKNPHGIDIDGISCVSDADSGTTYYGHTVRLLKHLRYLYIGELHHNLRRTPELAENLLNENPTTEMFKTLERLSREERIGLNASQIYWKGNI